MSDQTTPLGIVTPSFYGDFVQCRLLCESFERFCKVPYRHYLVVDRADVKLFSELASSTTEVIAKEDVLPRWVSSLRIPLPKKNRYVRPSFKSQPIRGWIAQQMAKLGTVVSLEHEHVIMVDSDVVLIRPLHLDDLVRGGLSPLYAKPNEISSAEPQFIHHIEWQRISERMLGLDAAPEPFPDFITPFNFWRPSNARRLRERMEATTGRDWMVSIARAKTFCEPVAYGLLVLDEGPETCGHRMIDAPLCYSYWTPRPISNAEMKDFLDKRPEGVYAVNIQSKAEMPIESYAYLVRGEV